MKSLPRSVAYLMLAVPIILLLLLGFIAVLVNLANSSSNDTADAAVKFSDCAEIAEWVERQSLPYYYSGRGGTAVDGSVGQPVPSETPRPDYSPTNIQVAGVDEADIVKTDGQYMYALLGNAVYIVDVRDAANLTKVAELRLSTTPQEMFLAGDKLVLLGGDYGVGRFGAGRVAATIYDVSNPAQPRYLRGVKFDGSYATSRLIDNNLYLIGNYYAYLAKPGMYEAEDVVTELLPQIADINEKRSIQDSDFVPMADCTDVLRLGQQGDTFTTIVALDLNTQQSKGTVMLGNSSTVYMSLRNLFITAPVYEEQEPDPQPCDWYMQLFGLCPVSVADVSIRPIWPTTPATTNIYRFAISGQEVNYASTGNVPGVPLNQFSLDEHSGYLRIATTITDPSRLSAQENNLYVLDSNMQKVGEVTGLAKGEQIFAVRYMGERAYVVTFRQIDPLFVIDLSQPSRPEVLGELKIPGFSNYLHPYDENHLIGVGREVETTNDFGSVTTGIKVGLFDVSDPNNPQEIDKVVIGDQGSFSDVLNTHKAFLFDRERELLVLPVTKRTEGSNTYMGSFVTLRVNLADGITPAADLVIPAQGTFTNKRGVRVNESLIGFSNGYLISSQLFSSQILDQVLLGDEPNTPIF